MLLHRRRQTVALFHEEGVSDESAYLVQRHHVLEFFWQRGVHGHQASVQGRQTLVPASKKISSTSSIFVSTSVCPRWLLTGNPS